jgi:hypothetical protein
MLGNRLGGPILQNINFLGAGYSPAPKKINPAKPPFLPASLLLSFGFGDLLVFGTVRVSF